MHKILPLCHWSSDGNHPLNRKVEGMKSYKLNKSQILKTLMSFTKRCKWKHSDALNTLFMVSPNLYSPTLMAQPLSTASFPALKRKYSWNSINEWGNSWFLLPPQTTPGIPIGPWNFQIFCHWTRSPSTTLNKNTLSIRSWKSICYSSGFPSLAAGKGKEQCWEK